MKAHPMVGDTLIAVLIAMIDLLLYVVRAVEPSAQPRPGPWYITLPLVFGVVAPLVFRRKYPITAAYLALAIGIPHSLAMIGIGSLVTSCIALYTLVAYVNRRAALLYLAVNEVISLVQLPLQQPDEWVIGI